MINNSVLDESLGIVNGLGQSLASLARMVGPGFGGMLWSISTKVITTYLSNGTFIYCISTYLSILLTLVVYLTFCHVLCGTQSSQ